MNIRTTKLEKKIKRLVYDLYGLMEMEMKLGMKSLWQF